MAVHIDACVTPAILELVENAVRHVNDPQGRVTISVGTTDKRVAIAISDTGPGIPTQERRVIETGTEEPLEHGSGVGLWFASWLLSYFGGDIDIDVDSEGTTVTASLPMR